jgi:NAD(P)-dependent dehydrogenase (short-subunit alcohol dehydrogenase family)
MRGFGPTQAHTLTSGMRSARWPHGLSGSREDLALEPAEPCSPADARTREGVDRGFAQNFLGAFLLTRLLEERLLASAPARVIAVGSSAHRLLDSADIETLMRPPEAAPPMASRQRGRYQMRSYQTAKLAVTTWVYRLARRCAGRGVTANLLDPGIVKGKSGCEQYQGPALTGVLMSRVIPFFVAAGM